MYGSPSVKKMRAVSFHGSGGFWFPKGQDDKIIDDLKGRWLRQLRPWIWALRSGIPWWFRPLERFPDQTGHGERFAKSGRPGYYADKGWMCVQVFFNFSKTSSLSGDVNLFYNDPDEDFLTYVGQFYPRKNLTWFPNEVLIPQDVMKKPLRLWIPRFQTPTWRRKNNWSI